MKIQFLGAAGEVTGSRHLVEAMLSGESRHFMVDYGMFQGGREATNKNLEPLPFSPKDLDFVVLTHACSTLLASILAPTMLAEVGVAFSTTIASFVVLAQPEFALFAMSPVVFGTLRKMLALHCFILGKKKAS